MRKSLWVLFVIVSLLVAACGPATVPATPPETETGEVFQIALPRVIIDFDAEGVPSVWGMKVADVGRLLNMDLSMLRIDKFYVDWMTAANVQHIDLRYTGAGVALLVNGKMLPHLAMTDEALSSAIDFAKLFNVQGTDLLKKLIPIVRRLGLDITVRFPKQAGAAEIPFASDEVALATAQPEEGPAAAIARFEIKYDANGVPAILGISAQDLLALGINLPVALHPTTLATLQYYNIQHMELRGKPDGLYVYVNGSPLPNIVWDNDMLINAADIYAQTNPASPYIELAKTLVPTVDNIDLDILVHFPLAAGATPIPAQMHY
jgi:hypothetical protein